MIPFEVVAVIRMGNENSYFYLKPLAMSPNVSRLAIVRPLPPSNKGEIEKSSYHEVSGGTLPQLLLATYLETLRLCRNPDVKAVFSINPIPYGFIALMAGRRAGKPVHLGFVGSDWYQHCRKWYGVVLNRYLRKADLFTVTGPKMKQEMVDRGYPEAKIHYLPHAVDLEVFDEVPADARKYDCVFVGSIIRRKRIDLILEATAIVKRRFPGISVCLVGDGPLMTRMKELARELGVDENVNFAGHQVDPSPWFSQARIVLIASDMEGFPFAMVEGMAAGAVPIATDVGTISDFIDDGNNGYVIPTGDAGALAERIERLIGDPQEYSRISQQVSRKREELSFEYVSRLWSTWLPKMVAGRDA